MKNKTTRLLMISLIGVALLCVCVFSFLAIHMSAQSAKTITEVGTLYMSTVSRQTSIHFDSIITLRMDQMDTLVETVPAEKVHTDQPVREELARDGRSRNFDCLAFYKTDGAFETVYGPELTVSSPEPFLDALMNGENMVTVGTTAQGEEMVLLGVPAPHPATEEHSCAGLVAGLPANYIRVRPEVHRHQR